MTELRWHQMTPEELEREYSPSSVLPDGDYRPFIERYVAESAAAWTQLADDDAVAVHQLVYGDLSTNTIDVAVPVAGGSSLPLLVFVHGGYWQELSKAESRFAAADCIGRGWAFAAIDYTLAPAISVAGIVDETRRAMHALADGAAELGCDSARIVVAGSSAGAHLAAMAALDADGPPLRGAVLVSGIYDLEPLCSTSINDALGLDATRARQLSPLLADVARFPPTLIAIGEHETAEFRAQSAAFADALDDAGVANERLDIAGRNHFDAVLDLARPATALGDAVARLVDQP